MSMDTSLVVRSHEENWLPILELAVEEVFEIMLGSRVKPVAKADHPTAPGGFTAMVGLAGGLCGILTFSSDRDAARELAKCMLGPEIADSEEQISDALGEICNMIAGNFETGGAQMKATSQATFDQIAGMLRQRNCRVRIEGHTDNVPIHNAQFSSNWELSTARATEIVRLLIVRDGFNPTRLSAAGYAEYHPIASNATADGRGTNRRVDIVILGHDTLPAPTDQAVPPTQIPSSTQIPSAPEPAASTKTIKPSPTIGLEPAATHR
jgi:outer membrane protein OmpA-like peptidoglycan-associated protein